MNANGLRSPLAGMRGLGLGAGFRLAQENDPKCRGIPSACTELVEVPGAPKKIAGPSF